MGRHPKFTAELARQRCYLPARAQVRIIFRQAESGYQRELYSQESEV